MRALIAAPLVFLGALLVQVVVWRWRAPVGQYSGLVALHVTVLAAATAVFYVTSHVLPATAFDYLNFAMLYLALVAAFAITYSAIQADSPTMTILLAIEAAGSTGIAQQELLSRLTDEMLVVPRINDLVAGGLAALRQERYVIGPRGMLLARTYISCRTLMRLEKGG